MASTIARAEHKRGQEVNLLHYLHGRKINAVNRQDFLERALDWVSKGTIDEYMSRHRKQNTIDELKRYFNTVIEWVSAIFHDVEKEMCGVEWGRLYETYHTTAYNSDTVSEQVHTLYADLYVKNRKGIFEYILGGSNDTSLLNVRLFDEVTKRSVYDAQTKEAKAKEKSNCPLCAVGHDANHKKIWSSKEMDADHVTAWKKGGATSEKNCQLLCTTHNRAKGNR